MANTADWVESGVLILTGQEAEKHLRGVFEKCAEGRVKHREDCLQGVTPRAWWSPCRHLRILAAAQAQTAYHLSRVNAC